MLHVISTFYYGSYFSIRFSFLSHFCIRLFFFFLERLKSHSLNVLGETFFSKRSLLNLMRFYSFFFRFFVSFFFFESSRWLSRRKIKAEQCGT